MSIFGVTIGVICQTMFLSDKENSSFSNRSTKTTSKKEKKKLRLNELDVEYNTHSIQVART